MLVNKFKARVFNEVNRFRFWIEQIESPNEGKPKANAIKTAKFSLNIAVVKNIVMLVLVVSELLEKQLCRCISFVIFSGFIRPKLMKRNYGKLSVEFTP